jgi:uncharacterized protein YutD
MSQQGSEKNRKRKISVLYAYLFPVIRLLGNSTFRLHKKNKKKKKEEKEKEKEEKEKEKEKEKNNNTK